MPVPAPQDPTLAANEPKVAGEAPAPFVPDRVVVRWRDTAVAPAIERARGFRRLAQFDHPAAPAAVVDTGGRPVPEVLAELRRDPNVLWAEPDYQITLAETAAVAVNDARTGAQYALDRMRVRDAWSLTTGGGSLVAVLDTGVDAGHPDLRGRVAPGWDAVNNDSNAADDNGHGTWVAGVIAANTNNGIGIAGISWSDRILPVKVMGANGTGTTSSLAFGIRWAADHGAKVINMSVGGFPHSTFVLDSVNYAWSKGAVLVGAAGNNRLLEEFLPASYPNVISVSATQEDDEFANWSSYGAKVDVSAPGASILTTDCTACPASPAGSVGYAIVSGTSFATPNTAAVVALIRARFPTMTNQQVVDRLLATVDDRGYAGWDNRYGRGRVNAARAVGLNVAAPASRATDAAEPNNGWSTARRLGLGTVRPSIYPAGDADHFYVDAPRAGRINVSVTAIIDTARVPKSALHVDPILQLYNSSGALLATIDHPTDSGATERGSVSLGASGGRVLIRVSNWFPNGNWAAYSLTTSYVDTVAPLVMSTRPRAGEVGIASEAEIRATFSEPVSGISAASLTLRAAGGSPLPASVSYDAATRTARLRPLSPLTGERQYTVSTGAGIVDAAGLPLPATAWSFTTTRAVPRLAGADRYATAAALSAATFAPGVGSVVLATGADFPDALAGGPVLLVARDALPQSTARELARLKPGRIVILGGTGSVSAATEAAARAFGSVVRIAGADRYATAAAASAATFAAGAAVVYVVSGEGYADALGASAVAGRDRAPLLLVGRTSIPSAVDAELTRLRPGRIVVVGGPSVVSDAVAAALDGYTGGTVTRIAGADRYATAAALSAAAYRANGPATVHVATGTNFPDALAASAAAAREGGPILLSRPDRLLPLVANELRRLDPSTVYVAGGPSSVSEPVRAAIRSMWP